VIGAPLNDTACLAQIHALATSATTRDDVRAVAARFATTKALAGWIRSLPQRDDTGDDTGEPQVQCDVPQRSRLLADDPNCLERSLLYLAAAEVIDPSPLRQLATVDLPSGRHTFPVEDGQPIILDPRASRNGLRAGLWNSQRPRNGTALGGVNAPELVAWIADIAEDIAEQWDGERGLRRVERARAAVVALFDGQTITPRDRADVLFVLRAATQAAPLFGEAGLYGVGLARKRLAHWVTARTRWRRRPRNLEVARIADVGARVVATRYGVGPIYDVAMRELRRLPRVARTTARARPGRPVQVTARAAMVLPSLEALRRDEGED
jgi:hypothetical protein